MTPPAASGPAEPVEQEPDGDLVGHELPRVHVAAGLDAQGRPVADGGPEQVAGGHDRDAEPVASNGAWVPFPAPGAPRRMTTFSRRRMTPRRRRRDASERTRCVSERASATPAWTSGGASRMKPSYWRMSSWASSCFIVSTTTETTIRMPVPPSARPWNCGWIMADERGSGGDDAQEQGAGDGDPRDHLGQVVLRGTPRPDARDEPAVLAQLLGGLVRLERERRVEVREPDGQQEVQRRRTATSRWLSQVDDPVARCRRRCPPAFAK